MRERLDTRHLLLQKYLFHELNFLQSEIMISILHTLPVQGGEDDKQDSR
jgi:hypothetical protein